MFLLVFLPCVCVCVSVCVCVCVARFMFHVELAFASFCKACISLLWVTLYSYSVIPMLQFLYLF